MNKLNKPFLFLSTLSLIVIAIIFSAVVIKNFSSPLMGLVGIGPDEIRNHDSVENWEYMGFYFIQNLQFNPFPHLDLVNNQVFYPYGVNSVFQAWGIERNLLQVFLYQLGFGNCLQFYYLLSVLITTVGTFLFLYKDYGKVKGAAIGLLVSFFNFYAIHKYPHHINIAVVHWTILSFIVDFLIVKRIVNRQYLSLKLLLARGCLLILCLGQDLGYIAGFALMSFTVSSLFIAVVQLSRIFRGKLNLKTAVIQGFKQYQQEFQSQRIICLSLIGLGLLITYLYLPLVVQIYTTAKSFESSGLQGGTLGVSPYRLLIPFFPMVNPSLPWEQFIGDKSEGFGGGSPGWFLLILGGIGLWHGRDRITPYLPVLMILTLCFFYRPDQDLTLNEPTLKRLLILGLGMVLLWFTRKRQILWIPILLILVAFFSYKPLYFKTLQLFPWFSFNRVGDRSTLIYPVILGLLALEIQVHHWRKPMQRVITGLLVVVACTELYTAYSFKQAYQPYIPNQDFYTYMEVVKNQPGEAVLDWPFCIGAGTGASKTGLCPYYRLNSTIYAMRQFHQKKVMGQYFGRLHPDQVQPYLQAGWPQLFSPNSQDIREAVGQTQCWTEQEWSFFDDFYRYNDFAGINLYVDLMPETCVQEFYQRFGQPVAQTQIPGPGQVQFIPKSPQLRNQVNPALGLEVQLKP